MIYCFDNNMHFDYVEKEIELLVNNNKRVVFFDSKLGLFLDSKGNKVRFKGDIVFPRTGSIQVYDMNDAIIMNGGRPIVSNQDINNILLWPFYVHTKRKSLVLLGSSLTDSFLINYLEKEYGDKIFFKTKEKNFSGVIPLSLLRDQDCAFYKAILEHINDTFIISECVDILKDRYGNMEYRCFVINGEIYNISRITTDVLHSIDSEVFGKAKEIVNRVKRYLPGYYVLDLFYYVDKSGDIVLDILEINPIHASGIYLYNSIVNKSNDILHTDVQEISEEFKLIGDDLKDNGLMIESRENNYSDYGSFAGDLRSICLTGSKGVVYMSSYIDEDDFARHNAKFDFNKIKPLMSDADLMSNSGDTSDIKRLSLK